MTSKIMSYLIVSAIAATAATGLMGDTLYWNPENGSGAVNSTYGYKIGSSNWTNSQGVVSTPTDSDICVLDHGGNGVSAYGPSGSGTIGGLVYRGCSATVNQGTVTFAAGGTGLDLTEATGNVAWYAGLKISGTGEVPCIVPASRTIEIQKTFEGSGGVLVKEGAGTLILAATWYDRTFSAGGLRIEEGIVGIGNCAENSGTFTLTFGGDGTTLKISAGTRESDNQYINGLSTKGLVVNETSAVTGTTHQLTSDYEVFLRHTGGSAEVASSSFSGQLAGKLGLMWKPYSSSTEFVFRKAESSTTGSIVVSNGTVRVTEGARFPSLSAVEVDGATSAFAVDASAAQTFPSTAFSFSNGGKLSLASGVYIAVASVSVDGVAQDDGVYHGSDGPAIGTTASWIDGSGVVVVGSPSESTPATSATWDGVGTDTAATTLANWNGAESLPDLTGGTLEVPVTGGSVFTADVDAFVRGFSVNGVTPFTIEPASGKTLWIGAGGIAGSAVGNKITVGGEGTVVVAEEQAWTNATFTLAGHITAAGDAVTRICHSTNSRSPGFEDGLVVDGDLLFIDISKVKQGYTTITVPANANITFNGKVVATNTSSIGVSSGADSTVTFNDLFMSRDGGALSGSGTIVFNGPMHFRDRSNVTGGTIELHSTGNRLSGFMGTWKGGTVKTMVPYAINKTNTIRQTAGWDNNSADGSQTTWLNLKDTITIDLCGNDQSIDQLGMHANGTSSGGHITSDSPATFHLQTSSSYWPKHCYSYGFKDYESISDANSYGYETADKGYWEGAVNLSYEAADGMVRSMMRQSSSTGRIEVASGRLVFLRRAATDGETFDLKGGTSNPYPRLADEDGGWTNATAVVVTGGTLAFEHGNAIGRDTDVYLYTSGGQLEIAAGVRQKCNDLYIDDVKQPIGAYGATGSGARHVNDTVFSTAGTGVLAVMGDGLGMTIILR